MGPNPRYLEELRVGGGYGDSADGGADFEKNGNIRTNGALLVDGAASVGSLAITGKFETSASTSSHAGLRVTPGIVPSLLQDGDVWTTLAGIYVRINGVTVGPLGTGGSGSVDWANPGALGATTPNTGVFSTLNTTGNVVCAGDARVNGGNFHVGVAGVHNGHAEIFGNNATVGGKLVIHKGAAATGVADYSIQSSAIGVLLISNGVENVLSLDGNTRRVGVNVTAPSVALDVSGSGKFSGRLNTAASTGSEAGLNLPHGSAPDTPVNGDVWTTSAGIYVRINGATVGPLGTGGEGVVDWANPGVIGCANPNEAMFTNLIVSNTLSTPPSTSSLAGLNIAYGVAPDPPSNGDVWADADGFYFRISGKTLKLKEAWHAVGVSW